MTVESAATFLASTILIGSGVVLGVIVLVVVNNIFAKYWKPVKIWMPHYFDTSHRFATPEEIAKIAPHLEDEKQNVITKGETK
jgi:hypothetical protein